MLPLTLTALVILASCSSAPQSATQEEFEAITKNVLTSEPTAEVGIAWRNLRTNQTFQRASNEVMHAASTMKIAVMIEVFRRIDRGVDRLDQAILLKDTFPSILDGTPYQLTAADDSDGTLYQALGETRSTLELVTLMMTRSSNLATNLLIEICGAQAIQKTIESLGTHQMKVLRGVQDIPAFEAGLNNVTTARDLMVLLGAIALDTAASGASCERMRQILLSQEFNESIPAGLPKGTPVAHKTGTITAIHHDAAIVLPAGRDPYVLVVLTRGIPDQKRSASLIAKLSRAIWSLQSSTNSSNP
jgi:beta-lactamase class A